MDFKAKAFIFSSHTMFRSSLSFQTDPIDSVFFEFCYIDTSIYSFPFYRDLKTRSTRSAASFIESFSEQIPLFLVPFHPQVFFFHHDSVTAIVREGKEKERAEQVIVFENVQFASELWKPITFLTFPLQWFRNFCCLCQYFRSFCRETFLISTAFLWFYLKIAKSKSLPLQNCLIDHYTMIPPVDSTVTSKIFDSREKPNRKLC